jgi:hypothetical protein
MSKIQSKIYPGQEGKGNEDVCILCDKDILPKQETEILNDFRCHKFCVMQLLTNLLLKYGIRKESK